LLVRDWYFCSLMSDLQADINIKEVPSHVAVIMDGNGRWAKQKGNQRIFGHKNAIKAVRDTVEAAAELKVKFLTLYAFSTQNWNRPKIEVEALMTLLVESLKKELPILQKNNIKLVSIGDQDRLPSKCLSTLNEVISQTKQNTHMTLNLALSYSGRWDLQEATRKIAQQVKKGIIEPSEISEMTITENLSTRGMPDPSLMIRTSGEYRLSNFLLWELSYAEFIFTDILWPDFRKEHFYKAIQKYQKRERRFGKTS